MNNVDIRLSGDPFEVAVGGLSRSDLRSELSSRQVELNAHAQTLIDDAVFDDGSVQDFITVVVRKVSDLGLKNGATLTQIFDAAQEIGLMLCPPTSGPYLRLAVTWQEESTDPAMSRGRAPEGSYTVAAQILRDDDEYPKGFYLRVINGKSWLRAYRCDDIHIWSPDDQFIFRQNS